MRLQNKTLPVVVNSLLDAEQKEIYDITLELKGNKPYLWDDIYTGGGGSYDPGSDYIVPGEALSDPAFAALITEAEKYLGWPYVWGGSSPSTCPAPRQQGFSINAPMYHPLTQGPEI